MCAHRGMCAQKNLPAAPHGALAGTASAPVLRSQQGPKSSFAPSRESGEVEGRDRSVGHLGPQPAVCESSASNAGKGRETSSLPVPY